MTPTDPPAGTGPPIRLVEVLDEAAVPPGWTPREGLVLPAEPWDLGERRWACLATVASGDDAQAAIAAGARGVGLVLQVGLAGAERRRFLEDLHRLGPVQALHGGAIPAQAVPAPLDLPDDHAGLLDLLVLGRTVTAAAEELHISRRTANRWLAEARAALGAATTAAALTRWTEARQPRRR